VGGERVSFTIDVASNGRLRRVVIDRWNSDPKNGSVGYMRQGSVHVFLEAELDDVTYH
jgi:hypothetical protein